MQNHPGTSSGAEVDFSVVIPVYNGERTITELCTRIDGLFQRLGYSYEIVAVEDCGRDGSWDVLAGIARNNAPVVRAVKLAKNFGQHNAILCGLGFCRGRMVITCDDDLQNPPEEMEKLIEEWKKSSADVVYGIYRDKAHGLLRNLASRLVQGVFSRIFHMDGNITSFRLFTRDIAKKLSSHQQSFVFIDGLIHWYTRYVSRVYVMHLARGEGRSGYTAQKLVSLALNLVFNFTTLPLRVVVALGFLISTFSVFLGVFFIVRKFIYAVPIGYTSVVVTLLFSLGSVMFVLGVIGEYICRLYALQNRRPQYAVRETSWDTKS